MSDKRLNSEKKIENDYFKLKVGTINKNNPKVVYVEGQSFIKPVLEHESYNDVMYLIRTSFKKNVSQHLRNNDIFDNKYILDFQIASNRMELNKKSFLSFQIMFRQKNEKLIPLKEIAKNEKDVFESVANNLAYSLEQYDFEISKTKK